MAKRKYGLKKCMKRKFGTGGGVDMSGIMNYGMQTIQQNYSSHDVSEQQKAVSDVVKGINNANSKEQLYANAVNANNLEFAKPNTLGYVLESGSTGLAGGTAAFPGWGTIIGGILGVGFGFGRAAIQRNALSKLRKSKEAVVAKNIASQDQMLTQNEINASLANQIAYGGGLNGKINDNTVFNMVRMLNKNGKKFGIGGGLNNPAGYPVVFGAGGTHEENMNEGIPQGYDVDGVQNLVEENEVKWNDYIFSDRIKVPDWIKEAGLPSRLKGKTFAKAAQSLTKESDERKFDAVSRRGLNAHLERLAAAQEVERMKEQVEEMIENGELGAEASVEEDAQNIEGLENAEVVESPEVPEEGMEEVVAPEEAFVEGDERVLEGEPQQFAEGGDLKEGKEDKNAVKKNPMNPEKKTITLAEANADNDFISEVEAYNAPRQQEYLSRIERYRDFKDDDNGERNYFVLDKGDSNRKGTYVTKAQIADMARAAAEIGVDLDEYLATGLLEYNFGQKLIEDKKGKRPPRTLDEVREYREIDPAVTQKAIDHRLIVDNNPTMKFDEWLMMKGKKYITPESRYKKVPNGRYYINEEYEFPIKAYQEYLQYVRGNMTDDNTYYNPHYKEAQVFKVKGIKGYNPSEKDREAKIRKQIRFMKQNPDFYEFAHSVYNESREFADGGTIHIKDSHKGLFSKAAANAGMGVQAYANKILSHPENYSAARRKQANFARNAAKWHDDGGSLHTNVVHSFKPFKNLSEKNILAVGGPTYSWNIDNKEQVPFAVEHDRNYLALNNESLYNWLKKWSLKGAPITVTGDGYSHIGYGSNEDNLDLRYKDGKLKEWLKTENGKEAIKELKGLGYNILFEKYKKDYNTGDHFTINRDTPIGDYFYKVNDDGVIDSQPTIISMYNKTAQVKESSNPKDGEVVNGGTLPEVTVKSSSSMARQKAQLDQLVNETKAFLGISDEAWNNLDPSEQEIQIEKYRNAKFNAALTNPSASSASSASSVSSSSVGTTVAQQKEELKRKHNEDLRVFSGYTPEEWDALSQAEKDAVQKRWEDSLPDEDDKNNSGGSGFGSNWANIGRYAPLFTNMALLGKAMREQPQEIHLQRVGAPHLYDYMPYTPVDSEYIANQQRQQAEATKAALIDQSAGNAAIGRQSLLMANAQNQNAITNALFQVQQYNQQLKDRARQFNANVNQQNAAYEMQARQMNSAKADAEAQWRARAAAAREQAITQYISSIGNQIGNIAKEKRFEDIAKNMSGGYDALGKLDEQYRKVYGLSAGSNAFGGKIFRKRIKT